METNKINFNLSNATIDDIEFIFQLSVQTMKKDFGNRFVLHEDEQRRRAADEIQNTKVIMME